MADSAMPMDDTTTRRRRTQAETSEYPESGITVETGSSDAAKQQTPSHHKKKKRRRHDEEPFLLLFIKVGASLAILCIVTWNSYRWLVPYQATPPIYDDDDAIDDDTNFPEARAQAQEAAAAAQQVSSSQKINVNQLLKEASAAVEEVETTSETAPPLPTWDLDERTRWDAFGIAAQYEEASIKNQSAFWQAAKGLRGRFSNTYGGENAARAILQRGLTTSNATLGEIPRSVQQTACRIQQARENQRPFRMAFGGYSVTVGRGNYFSQSFPLVLEKLLRTVFQLLEIDLEVLNAAIGGCPAFPYGFCQSQFWGLDADVVSWDYSMNEAGGIAEGLEAYLRHALQLPRRPDVIVKDTHMAEARRNLLKQYEFIVVHTDPAVQPFLERSEAHRPPGFQEWRKFGSPLGAPGQTLHHPAIKEHELIAWMLAMQFLSALELLAAHQHEPFLQCDDLSQQQGTALPPPMAMETTTATKPWTSILFGQAVSEQEWRMNPMRCRTSFEPIISGDLTSIVVSGSIGEDLDVMLPKSKQFYNKAWVLDLSKGEKDAKHKLDVYGGLGFIDSKKAYYGIISSKTLRLLLPYERPEGSSRMPLTGDKAIDWFKAIVICEVNEKRESMGACQMEKDITLMVGGANVTDSVMMDPAGSLYLGKKICLYVPVPRDAELTTPKLMKQAETVKLLLPENEIDETWENQVGLSVDVSVNNQHVVSRDQACSVSHVVWEQQSLIEVENK